MKALTITNKAVTRAGLLQLAEEVPGAWIGIRIAALLLMLDGLKSTRVAELFGISRWSMVKWIQRVNGEGLSGVEEKAKPGRPARFDTGVRKKLEEALQRSPREFGLKRNRWDGIVVVEYLERVHGVNLKVRQAQRWIHRLGFSLRQPIYRYAQATKEGVKEFEQTIKKLLAVKRSKGRRMLLFSDESGFCLHPKLGRVWAKKGTQPFVVTRSQHHKRLNIFGWVDPLSGRHGIVKQDRGNTDGFLGMLTTILCRYKKVMIELWVDQARWHKGDRVLEFITQSRRLRISYIPKYHPELNPQERLWRTMRYEETTNTYYESENEMRSCIFKRSQSWKPAKILSLCHVI